MEELWDGGGGGDGRTQIRDFFKQPPREDADGNSYKNLSVIYKNFDSLTAAPSGREMVFIIILHSESNLRPNMGVKSRGSNILSRCQSWPHSGRESTNMI